MGKNSKKAIIIGSGFGGLSLAIRLQSLGFRTEIYEKNSKPGGHAYQLNDSGYTFDMGPSIITVPFLINELFLLNNEDMHQYLDLVKLDPFYRIYYHDKTYIDYNGDPAFMKQQLSKFNTNDSKNYDSFMLLSKRIYELVMEEGVGERPFSNLGDFVSFIPDAIRTKSVFPSHYLVTRYFKDPRIQFLFSFHPLFIGGNPFITPSIFLMLPYLESNGGVWFSKGGMYSVVEALLGLYQRMGGVLHTDSEVSQIVVENKIAKGVVVNGNFRNADLVVSNGHFAHTYMDLVKSDDRNKWSDKKIKNQKYSMSCYLLYLGVKKKFPELKHHTLILSERYKGLVKDLFSEGSLPNDFSMYLHAPSITDPSMAPAGCESLYVLVPTPNLKANIDWEKNKQPYAKKILDFLEKDFGLKDLNKNVEVMHIFTPKDFEEQRNNFLGAAWSVQPRLDQVANFRPHNKSEDISNLYLVGASVHPGGGVPGVILSAKVTEKLIKKDCGL